MPRRLYIQTVGCQMNVLDSELVAAELLKAGYELVDSAGRADTILFNTCSVRQHAEDKIYSALGRLKHVKDQQPQKIIGVIGCMAQKDQQRIFRRAPHVDLVVGPGQLGQLPALLARIADGGGPQIEVSLDRTAGNRASVRRSFERHDPVRVLKTRPAPHQAMVRIMFGCDKFCTYCVVPGVRGPEQSRPADEIEAEVRCLAEQGCLEVTLLGQTVNSYRDDSGGGSVRLADLLGRLNEVEGLRRLKFVTNHPQHMTPELLEAVRDLPKVSPYLHVPAQSGSDRILRRMKRGYTAGAYREMLARIRCEIPEAAVTSDFIVGFPGETQQDYQQTVELLREGQFKNSFIFKYSPRPKTKAAELYDDVPDEVKRRRNNELLAVQNAISLEDNRPLVGRRVEILVEGPSKVGRRQSPNGEVVQLVGRTVCDRIVVFDGPRHLAGRIMPIEIEKVDAMTLFGKHP
ncbi:MAG: tRNA (N6-isopentenyl adenosine(37)-C2)-methylthiotransferase MiaB [Planctomycetota bacterium]|jgi:tRNA-2-methylthio-N6-dimethylallyladenosine synthase